MRFDFSVFARVTFHINVHKDPGPCWSAGAPVFPCFVKVRQTLSIFKCFLSNLYRFAQFALICIIICPHARFSIGFCNCVINCELFRVFHQGCYISRKKGGQLASEAARGRLGHGTGRFGHCTGRLGHGTGRLGHGTGKLGTSHLARCGPRLATVANFIICFTHLIDFVQDIHNFCQF